MRWGTFIDRLAPRWRNLARTITLCVCSLALVLSSGPITVHAAFAAIQNSEIASRASVVAEMDHSAQPHQCKRGAVSAPSASCAVSSVSAGLLASVVVQPRPVGAGAQLDLALAGLTNQLCGLPLERPPRS